VHITTSSNLRFSLQEHYFQRGNNYTSPTTCTSIQVNRQIKMMPWNDRMMYKSTFVANFLMVQRNHRNFIPNFASLVLNISKDVSFMISPLPINVLTLNTQTHDHQYLPSLM
jgi:hypothetical protein